MSPVPIPSRSRSKAFSKQWWWWRYIYHGPARHVPMLIEKTTRKPTRYTDRGVKPVMEYDILAFIDFIFSFSKCSWCSNVGFLGQFCLTFYVSFRWLCQTQSLGWCRSNVAREWNWISLDSSNPTKLKIGKNRTISLGSLAAMWVILF